MGADDSGRGRSGRAARVVAVTPNDVHWTESMVRWLDDGLRIPGTKWRIGFDPILGLLAPALGDGLTALVSFGLLGRGLKEGLPKVVVARMVLNVLVDFAVGSIPLVGDLFDFGFKANRKNLTLLERHRGEATTHPRPSDYLIVAAGALLILAGLSLPIAAAILLARWLGGDG